MIKLLLVDDEEHDRNIIFKGVNWDKLPLELAGYAEDGDSALELAEITKPDIVMTDIKMPVKNGILLANDLRKRYPEIKIIFISGYHDFEYAKAGIEYNVFDYILKPIDVAILNDVLKKATEKCLYEKSKKYEQEIFHQQLEQSFPLLRERFFRDWVFDLYSDDQSLSQKLAFLDIQIKPGKILVMALQLDDYRELEKVLNEYEIQLLDSRALSSITEIMCRHNYAYCFVSRQGEYVIILQAEDNDIYSEQNISGISSAIRRNIYANCSQTCTIGIGGCSPSLSELSKYYKYSINALQFRFYYGKNQTFFYNDIQTGNTSILEKDYYKAEILKAVKIGDSKTANQLLDEMFLKLTNSDIFSIQYIRNICIELLSVCSNSIYESQNNIDGIDSFLNNMPDVIVQLSKYEAIDGIWNWMKKFIFDVCFYISSNVKKKNAHIVKSIKQLIDARYDNIVSIEEIANEINLSPGYISTVFKNETGETIIRYMTSVRMHMAEDFLKNTNFLVYEIAQRVGYNNVTHFASVFKNHMGVSPGEYRKK